MTKEQLDQLGKTLWDIANQLRGAMNADDFRDYMLSFLFLRYLSDNYEAAAKKELGRDYPQTDGTLLSFPQASEGAHETEDKTLMVAEDRQGYAAGNSTRRAPLAIWYEENEEDIADFEKQMRLKVHYVVEPDYLWSSIVEMARTQHGDLLDTLWNGFKYIEEKSFESAFQGLFSEINLHSEKLGKTPKVRNDKLCTIIKKIAEGIAQFSTDTDILGDAYEYLIGQFAAGSGKKAGEFYTPQQLSDILSAIVTLDGQEPKTGKKRKLNRVLDFAFLLHGFHFFGDDGVMAIILPHGVLFRGAAEARIRTKLLKDGHIDTVIGLPPNLFFSTGIPVCVLVLKKCKKPDDVLFINASQHFEKGKRQNRLLHTEEMPDGEIGHIEKIIETYQYRNEEKRYSRRVSLEEIEKNDYNLNISRYVSTARPEPKIDLQAVNAELVDLEEKIVEATQNHNDFLEELNLPPLP